MRSRMAFVTDDANLLPTLPEGPVVATVGEAAVALGTSPAAPAPPPPPASVFLVEHTFTGEGNSPGFFAQGQVEVCRDITPPRAEVHLYLGEEGRSVSIRGGDFTFSSGSACKTVDLPRAGRYWLFVDFVSRVPALQRRG